MMARIIERAAGRRRRAAARDAALTQGGPVSSSTTSSNRQPSTMTSTRASGRRRLGPAASRRDVHRCRPRGRRQPRRATRRDGWLDRAARSAGDSMTRTRAGRARHRGRSVIGGRRSTAPAPATADSAGRAARLCARTRAARGSDVRASDAAAAAASAAAAATACSARRGPSQSLGHPVGRQVARSRRTPVVASDDGGTAASSGCR